MSSPLAALNVEELHWQNDLGLPNQRRWLNHRNIGDGHRRTFPSAAGIVTQIISDLRFQIEDCEQSRQSSKSIGRIDHRGLIPLTIDLTAILNLKLSEAEFACAALFVLETTSDF